MYFEAHPYVYSDPDIYVSHSTSRTKRNALHYKETIYYIHIFHIHKLPIRNPFVYPWNVDKTFSM